MATKVKPSRLQITGTPQAWNVPVYVDQDTFQRWAWWWGGWDVKVFKLQWTTDYTTADDARDAYMLWEPVIVMLGTDAFRFTSGTVLYWDIPTVFSASWITIKMMVLTLDWNNKVTNIQVTNMSFSWPTVVDNLTTQSATSALSANQGKVLNDKISDLFWLGKFLSLWNATTWLPTSFPLQTPYTYSTWDYYLVSVVSSATPPVNYRPTWSSYSGTASSTTESDELEVWDVYIYDWSTWLLQSNHWKTVSFSNIAWQPTDNANLATALNAKADDNAVVKLTGDQTIAWTKTFSTSPVVPSKTTDATNTGTAIATEAQVYKKQDALTLPATPTQWHLVTWWADNKSLIDWWTIPTWFNPWGTATTGYVVTKTADGYEWQAPAWWIQEAPNSPITWIKYVWRGSEAQYAALSQYYTDVPWDTKFETY